MPSHALSKNPISHLRGIWGYLRLGVAVCAASFAVSGLVSLAQHGLWETIGALATGIALLIFVVGVAAVAPKTGASSPPALAEAILALFLLPEQSAFLKGDLAEMFTDRVARFGPTGARVWYWTQVARVVPFSGKGAAIRLVAEAMAGVTTILHLFMR